MKKRFTNRELRKNHKNIIRIPYCNLQYLLSTTPVTGYTSGIYGWNSDIYEINGIIISTGYRPIGNIKPDASTNKRYERAAEKIIGKFEVPYEKRAEEMRNILNDYLAEVCGYIQ